MTHLSSLVVSSSAMHQHTMRPERTGLAVPTVRSYRCGQTISATASSSRPSTPTQQLETIFHLKR
jgi:hypothetical protein